jgi:peptidyl-prolyl cis-trans isomerase B (cyclophilin B)
MAVPLKYAPCTIALLFVAACLGGCSKSKSAKDAPKADHGVPITATGYSQKSGNLKGGKSAANSTANPLEQPLLEAALLEPPDESLLRPPETTIAGKSVGRMFEAIAGHDGVGGLWDKIALTTPDGKIIRYTAKVITDLGTITIELWPDVAPNHVRNFIALAKVGYYNGLGFDVARREHGPHDTLWGLIEAGCPLGTGEPGYGSIGYWLKPEFSHKIHEPGTVGACREEHLESASTKFYITLSEIPGMDHYWTVFGKVIQGLDVARTIFQRPVDKEFYLEERVLIREVTIQTQ